MSHRFKISLQFWIVTLVWLIAGTLTCVYSHWYWFIVGWVVVAALSSGYEFFTYNRRIVAHWERLPWWYNFLVHFFSPLLQLVMLYHLPRDYQEWKATPKPRYRNYDYSGGHK